MGTAWHENYTVSVGFSRADTDAPDTARAAVLYGNPVSLSPGKPIPGSESLTKKRELFPGSAPTSPTSFALPHMAPKDLSPCPGSGILTRFPFDPTRAQINWLKSTVLRFRTEFSYLLGPTDPCSTAVHMEPFSTSVFRGLVGIFATTTEICTRGGSSRARARTFDAHRGDPPTRRSVDESKLPAPTAGHRLVAPAPSIFRASRFGR